MSGDYFHEEFHRPADPSKLLVTSEEEFTQSHNFNLWTFGEVEAVHGEIDDDTGYEKILDKKERQVWKKVSGEGSKSYDSSISFPRHKYTCEMDFSLEHVYTILRDYQYRHEWDKGEVGREVAEMYEIDGYPNQTIERFVRKGFYPISSREMILLVAETMKFKEGANCSKNQTRIPTEEMDHPNNAITLHLMKDVEEVIFSAKSVDTDRCVHDPESGAVLARLNKFCSRIKRHPEFPDSKVLYSCLIEMDPMGKVPSLGYSMIFKHTPKEFEKGIVEGSNYRKKKGLKDGQFENFYHLSRV